VLALYETVAEALDEQQLERALGADWVTFTSSSTVRFLAAAAGGRLQPTGRVASIGPQTSATLREHGVKVDVEASRHDIDGLLEALLEAAGARA
jgi:uroporphyrinogen III methyltransferase / synthase